MMKLVGGDEPLIASPGRGARVERISEGRPRTYT
jgi:hypothetical protein